MLMVWSRRSAAISRASHRSSGVTSAS
jgi:hypothetical protein